MQTPRALLPFTRAVSRGLLLWCAITLLAGGTASAADKPGDIHSDGARIFREGRLPDGSELLGERAGGVKLQGAAVACIACHRRSGLGTTEGQIVIPPITGKYLFRTAEKNIKDLNLPHVSGYRAKRTPYTDETLARVIREGVDSDGRPLNYLMPHFKLDNAAMASLISYIKELTSAPVPGVTDDTLHFATIITPDADPVAKKGMLDVMEKFFTDKNEFLRGGARTIQSQSRAIMYRVTRRWELHVWELTGPPEDWARQLRAKLAAQPVFAVLSGLAGKNWAPVHKFCEDEALPCLFPNVDLPVDAEQDFYSLYLSKGVLLEPELIAATIARQDEKTRPKRLIQVFRPDDIGAAAAKVLPKRPGLQGITIESRELPGGTARPDYSKVFRDLTPGDELVLWLRPSDISALPATIPPVAHVVVSGTMGNLEHAPVPPTWRAIAHLAYPLDTPDFRKLRLDYTFGWFRIRRIPVVAERVQADTYLACGIVSEIVKEMLDSFVRDYLVERTEVMLSHRLVTGYYPRLSLAPGQRFASKGGYLMHFADDHGTKVIADGDWIVP